MAVLLITTSCTAQATPSPFVPPTAEPALPVEAPSTSASAITPTASPAATQTAVEATPTPCSNDLQFVQDLSIPDGTMVTPGQQLDKQWLVTNIGTCNWGAGYRLKMISGDAMGASVEQALYPARAGTQATLHVLFTAPQTAGTYQNAWQAFTPDGTGFGQAVYLQINVSP